MNQGLSWFPLSPYIENFRVSWGLLDTVLTVSHGLKKKMLIILNYQSLTGYMNINQTFFLFTVLHFIIHITHSYTHT